jgi:hypothetical protein
MDFMSKLQALVTFSGETAITPTSIPFHRSLFRKLRQVPVGKVCVQVRVPLLLVAVAVKLGPTVVRCAATFLSNKRKLEVSPDAADVARAERGIGGLDSTEPIQDLLDVSVPCNPHGLVVRRGRRLCFAGRLAKECQDQFGLIKPTPANEMVARKWMQLRMVELNVRVAHRADVMPYALALFFKPTAAMIGAMRMSAARPLEQRDEEFEEGVYTRRRWPRGTPGVGGQYMPLWLPGAVRHTTGRRLEK